LNLFFVLSLLCFHLISERFESDKQRFHDTFTFFLFLPNSPSTITITPEALTLMSFSKNFRSQLSPKEV
jgi:hypothetical protein